VSGEVEFDMVIVGAQSMPLMVLSERRCGGGGQLSERSADEEDRSSDGRGGRRATVERRELLVSVSEFARPTSCDGTGWSLRKTSEAGE
jgi:hypothetical protein